LIDDVVTYTELSEFLESNIVIMDVAGESFEKIVDTVNNMSWYGKIPDLKISADEKIHDLLDSDSRVRTERQAWIIAYLQACVKLSNLDYETDTDVSRYQKFRISTGVTSFDPAYYVKREIFRKSLTLDPNDVDEFDDDPLTGYQRYYEEIEKGTFVNLVHNGYRLPGHHHSYASCGHFVTKSCKNMSEHRNLGHGDKIPLVKVPNHCRRISCQECYQDSIKGIAMNAVDRLWSHALLKKSYLYETIEKPDMVYPLLRDENNPKKNRRYHYLEKREERIFSHVVVSIPKSDYHYLESEKGQRKIRDNINSMLKYLGIHGAVRISHLWRFQKGLKSGYYSPHLHVVGLGWIDPSRVKENYEQTGYIIKNVSTIKKRHDLFNLVRYILSHSAVLGTKHSVQYIGEMHNTKFRSHNIRENSVSSLRDLDMIFKKYENSDDDMLSIEIDVMKQSEGPDQADGIRSFSSKCILSYDSVKSVRGMERTAIKYPHIIDEEYDSLIPGNVFHGSRDNLVYGRGNDNDEIDPSFINSKDNPAKTQSIRYNKTDLLYDVIHESIPRDDEIEPPPQLETMQYHVIKFTNILKKSVQYLILGFDQNLGGLCPICSERMVRVIPSQTCNIENAEKYLRKIPESIVLLSSRHEDWVRYDYRDPINLGIFYITKPCDDCDIDECVECGKFGYDDKREPIKSKFFNSLTADERLQYDVDCYLLKAIPQFWDREGHKPDSDEMIGLLNGFLNQKYIEQSEFGYGSQKLEVFS